MTKTITVANEEQVSNMAASMYAEALQGFSLDSNEEDQAYLDVTAEMNGVQHTYK
jgi:hypothetical protein